MEQKTVNLYTRQNDKTLYQLERNGRIINERIYVELHFGDIAPLFMEATTGLPGRRLRKWQSLRM